MMTVEEFTRLPEWRKIREKVIEIMAISTDAALAQSGTLDGAKEAAVALMCQRFLLLPKEVLIQENPSDETKDSVADTLIAERPINELY